MKKKILSIDDIPAILWGEESDKVYIYVHGKTSNKDDAQEFSKIATQKGFQVLSFDLPEHGDRQNENYPCNLRNGVHDLGIVGNYVMANWNEIYLYGYSLGAYFSLLAYNDHSIKKCLFLSPVLDMARLIENIMKWFNISEQELREKQEIPTPMGETLYWDDYCYAKENPVEKWNMPTAILYGSEDKLTECEVVQSFAKQFNCDLTVLEDGEHWFHTEHQLTVLDGWLNKHI
jgi:pimeloyl-ACP methyl ester carboxylesterase